MKITRLGLALTAVLAMTVAGCSNHSADTEAAVYLTASITQGPADVDISVPADVTIEQMTITSQAKSPSAVLSGQQDVVLNEWVVTCERTDGGATASPEFRNFYTVTVPAGGTANLQNYRIFPAEYFNQAPLNQLQPWNGGKDPETGNRSIRQRLKIEIFGKTISGRKVAVEPIYVNLNFFYVTP